MSMEAYKDDHTLLIRTHLRQIRSKDIFLSESPTIMENSTLKYRTLLKSGQQDRWVPVVRICKSKELP